MFKDIRVRAALCTLGLFGVAAVSGAVITLVIQNYGRMAVLTAAAVAFAAYMVYSVYDLMLLKLQQEKKYQELSASLDEKTPTE
jgi:zinc transporter ZupT